MRKNGFLCSEQDLKDNYRFCRTFANYLPQLFVLAIVSVIGTFYYTSSNQIAPTYYYDTLTDPPAKQAGLEMGDRILKIDGQETANFHEVYEKIVLNPEKMTFTIERGSERFEREITPVLNKDTGAGYVGFYAYIPLNIVETKPNSPLVEAGILAGDRIIKIDGNEIANTCDLSASIFTKIQN